MANQGSGVTESPIIPEQLRLGRESIGLSLAEVAARIGISVDELTAWEAGRGVPPIEKLWGLADLYHRSVDYFVKSTKPLPQEVRFRLTEQIRDLPADVRAVIARFEDLCRFSYELESFLNQPREVKMRKYVKEASPERLAEQERLQLHLDGRPIKDLRGLLEEQGARIFELVIPDAFSGLSWWHDDYGPCILINARDTAGRRNFTIAHEYAHLLRYDLPIICDIKFPDSQADEERFAQRFAAAFLMPAPDVRNEFRERELSAYSIDGKVLGSLAGRYAVSLQAMAWRLVELDLLPQEMAGAFQEPKAHPRRPKTPTWRRRLGERYVSIALEAYRNGSISLGKLSQYLDIDVRDAFKEAGERS